MECARKAVVAPLNAGWSDVSPWASLWECAEQDNNNNILYGDVMIDDVNNVYIHGGTGWCLF